jgi:hypothetical protein
MIAQRYRVSVRASIEGPSHNGAVGKCESIRERRRLGFRLNNNDRVSPGCFPSSKPEAFLPFLYTFLSLLPSASRVSVSPASRHTDTPSAQQSSLDSEAPAGNPGSRHRRWRSITAPTRVSPDSGKAGGTGDGGKGDVWDESATQRTRGRREVMCAEPTAHSMRDFRVQRMGGAAEVGTQHGTYGVICWFRRVTV